MLNLHYFLSIKTNIYFETLIFWVLVAQISATKTFSNGLLSITDTTSIADSII